MIERIGNNGQGGLEMDLLSSTHLGDGEKHTTVSRRLHLRADGVLVMTLQPHGSFPASEGTALRITMLSHAHGTIADYLGVFFTATMSSCASSYGDRRCDGHSLSPLGGPLARLKIILYVPPDPPPQPPSSPWQWRGNGGRRRRDCGEACAPGESILQSLQGRNRRSARSGPLSETWCSPESGVEAQRS